MTDEILKEILEEIKGLREDINELMEDDDECHCEDPEHCHCDEEEEEDEVDDSIFDKQ